MTITQLSFILIFACASNVAAWAQRASSRRPIQPFQHFTVPASPEVHADRTVTFRYLDPYAKHVQLALEGSRPKPMHKGARDIWSLTIGPLEPEFYGYSYLADGVPELDPFNPLIKPNLLMLENEVYVPGSSSLPWQTNDVPHGVVDHIFYRSAVVGDNRDYFVYTPPGYDPRATRRYPVLYLLHGYSDLANAWTVVGRANIILDNLIDEHKAQPMIVVMPLGYGAPQIVSRSGPGFRNPALMKENLVKFREALLAEVIPQVESHYLVLTDREDHAIAGLSMGGGESLYVGLNHLGRFAWVGAFSAGLGQQNYAEYFPNLSSEVNPKLHLLWIACGRQDPVVGNFNRAFRAWLNSKGVRFTNIWTPGMHAWMVWRSNLAAFAPLLFQH
jgi:enterochelin esterase-like enzyme